MSYQQVTLGSPRPLASTQLGMVDWHITDTAAVIQNKRREGWSDAKITAWLLSSENTKSSTAGTACPWGCTNELVAAAFDYLQNGKFPPGTTLVTTKPKDPPKDPSKPPPPAPPEEEHKWWQPYLWPAVFVGSAGALAMLLFWRRDRAPTTATKLGSISDYNWFVLTPSGRIAAGYEYRPDAQDFIKDMPPKGLKLAARRTLAQQGINPNHATNWTRGTELGASKKKARSSQRQLTGPQTPRQCAINGLSWGGNTPTGEQIARVLEQVEKHAGDNPTGFAWRTGRNFAISKFRHQQSLAKQVIRDRHISERQEREIAAGENFAAAHDEFYKLLPKLQAGSYQRPEQLAAMLDALRLTFFEGESTTKVAAAQGVSSNVVDQRITRAKKLLRARRISNTLRAALATRRNAARL